MGNLKVLTPTEKLVLLSNDIKNKTNIRETERLDFRSGKLKRPSLDSNDATFRFDNLEKYDYIQLQNIILPTVERIKTFREYQKSTLLSDNSFYKQNLEYFEILQEVFEIEKNKISDFVESVGKYQQTLSDFAKEFVSVKIEIKDPTEISNMETLKPQYEQQILKNIEDLKSIDFEIYKCTTFIKKIEDIIG